MLNVMRLLKVSAAWISIVYIICFAGVALFPSSQMLFMRYALHSSVNLGQSIITLPNFVSGLIIWNIIAILGVGLFVVLFNQVKR